MKLLDHLLFRTQLTSDLNFEELKFIYRHRIGYDYFKGHIGKVYLSLYYLGKSIPIGGHRTKSHQMPFIRFIIDSEVTVQKKQVISFQFALYILIPVYLGLIGFSALLTYASILVDGTGFSVLGIGCTHRLSMAKISLSRPINPI